MAWVGIGFSESAMNWVAAGGTEEKVDSVWTDQIPW